MMPSSIGRYEVFAKLGKGGFATVYRAVDPTLRRDVAIKVLHPHLADDPQVRARFIAEGQRLARIRHPNLVQVYDAGEAAGLVYLAMEYVAGRSLEQLAEGQPLAWAELQPLVRQVAGALDAVHAAGLVHRDVKPANIMVTNDRRAVLLDLGIARAQDETRLTSASVLIGTPGFLAPEQVLDTAAVGPATDVYQLGVTIFTLLAGHPPFTGDTARTLYAIAHEPPPDLARERPDLPPEVSQAVTRALAKRPEDRPATASALDAALAGTELPAPASSPAGVRPLPMAGPTADAATVPRRRPLAAPTSPGHRMAGPPLLVAAGVAAALVLGVAAVLLTRPWGGSGGDGEQPTTRARGPDGGRTPSPMGGAAATAQPGVTQDAGIQPSPGTPAGGEPVVAPGRWTRTADMTTGRYDHSATLLPDGRVLVVGGVRGGSFLASAEVYDPGTKTWRALGEMPSPRAGHSATSLPDGRVLVVGGCCDGDASRTAVLFDPSGERWLPAGRTSGTRFKGHTATLLPNGRVLVVGGGGGPTTSELYDPATGAWSTAEPLPVNIALHHTATLLPGGRVLVAGGLGGALGDNRAALLYDPSTATWAPTGPLTHARSQFTATVLPEGRILVAGGGGAPQGVGRPSAELFDLRTGTWTEALSMREERANHTATLLVNGSVLVAGGTAYAPTNQRAELFEP